MRGLTESMHASTEHAAPGDVDLIAEYHRLRWALCAIPTGGKGPRTADWGDRPLAPDARPAGVGLIHARSGTCAIDLDDLHQAREWLAVQAIDLDALLSDDDAVHIDSGRPNRGKLLYRLPAGVAPLPLVQVHGSDGAMLFELRCAPKNGGAALQDVLPPTVHPSTGKPYRWAGNGDFRRLPELPPELLRLWQQHGAQNDVAQAPRGAIGEGSRNDRLYRQAAALRAKGRDEGAILDELRQVNAAKCKPPLPDTELQSIVRSAAKLSPGASPPQTPADDDVALPFASEQDLAERFIQAAAGAYRWTPGMDWMADMGAHWTRDLLLTRFTTAKRVCADAAAQVDNAKLRAKICAASTASAILSLARSDPGVRTPVEAWDAEPMLLNTPAGVFDLARGERVQANGALFTQITAVGPQARATPIWDKFLADVFAADLTMIEFIQRMVGYCLTGSTREQKLFFLHGIGANGKSVFLDVVRAIAGTYAHNLPSEALMASRHEGHPTMLASLAGKRLAISSEIEESAHWAEARIKALTGDETVTARFMRQDFFEFRLTHKHVIAGNFRPRLKGDDAALARRLVLIPFTQVFAGTRRDNHLLAKLRGEFPGILQWAIAGAAKWAATGLAIPPAVADASTAYLAEQNDLALWVDECCARDASATATAGELYRSFQRWKEQAGEHAPSIKSFSQRLERMFDKRRIARGIAFTGLRMRQPGIDGGTADAW